MKKLVGCVLVAVVVLVGASATASGAAADSPPVLRLDPSPATPGENVTFTVAITCRDSDSINLSLEGGGYDDAANAICIADAFRGSMPAPQTPGTYVARAFSATLSLKTLLTVTATGGGTVCDQAIAEAGTGVGAFGGYALVYAPAKGGSGSQVVVGTAGNDRLDGGSGADVLCGLGGDDVLAGGSGNDAIYGGEGADRLAGGSGDDSLDGGEGTDVLSGGSGDDILLNGETVDEGSGDDFVLGAALP